MGGLGAGALIVLDTHAWLWHVVAPHKLTRAARTALERSDEIGVSTMSCWEVVLLEVSGKLSVHRGARTWVAAALGDERIRAIPVSVDIAVRAGRLRGLHDPADRIIYATAVELNAQLVTRDERIATHDPDRVIW